MIEAMCHWMSGSSHFSGSQHYHHQGLTLNLLTTTIVATPSNASKWQMGFNSAFKGLSSLRRFLLYA